MIIPVSLDGYFLCVHITDFQHFATLLLVFLPASRRPGIYKKAHELFTLMGFVAGWPGLLFYGIEKENSIRRENIPLDAMQHGNCDCFKQSLILYVPIILLLWYSGKH